MSLIEDIKSEEGFSDMPYKDSRGFPTIGYGTLLPLTNIECEWLLEHRLNALKQELNQAVKKDYRQLSISQDAWDILDNMAYQMGVPRLMQFKRMWSALNDKNYSLASDEMLDSQWASQTPQRANRLAIKMRSVIQ